MVFLEKNIQVLNQEQKGFGSFAAETAFDSEGQVKVASAKDGTVVFHYERDGKIWRLNSAYRPVAEAEKWAGQYEYVGIGRCYILYGLGTGSFLRSLLLRCCEDARIFVYEPSLPIFSEAMKHCELEELFADSRVSLGVGDGLGASLYSWLDRYVTKENDRQLLICVHPVYDQLFPEKLLWVRQERKALTDRLTAAANTKNAYGKRVVLNTWKGLQRFTKDQHAWLLKDYPSDRLCEALKQKRPAILVSTGPSLSKSIDWLRMLSKQHKVVIFAADSALRYLINRGIRPDFVVTIDPVKWPVHFSKEESHDIPVFLRFDSNYKIIEQQTGDLIYFGGTPYPVDLFAALGVDVEKSFALDTGGSVATAAFTLCRMLGFEKIVLVGQDLCYDGEYTHVGNVVSVDEKKQGFGKVWIPGNDQEKVLTRQDWLRYLKWFEKELRLNPQLEVMNATSGGARIAGTRRMTLKKLYEELEGGIVEVSTQMEESVDTPIIQTNEPLLCSSELQKLRTQLRQELDAQEGIVMNLIAELSEASSSCADLQVLCQNENQTYQQLCQSRAYLDAARRVQQFLTKLETLPIASFLELLISEDEESQVYVLSGDPLLDELQTWRELYTYFEQLKKASKELMNFISDASIS